MVIIIFDWVLIVNVKKRASVHKKGLLEGYSLEIVLPFTSEVLPLIDLD